MPTRIVSHYTPLTYDEITKPLIQATQAQMAVEDAYMAASDKAAQALAQANEQTDPTAYRKLKSYADDLKSQADALAQYGLQKSSRQSLLNMHRRYGQEITPIDAAIARRSALMEEQRQARLKNPYLMYERDMGTVSLDELVGNPNMSYGRTIDGEDISRKAATLTKAFGQAVQDMSVGKQIDKYTKEILTREGFTTEQIMAAVNGDNSALSQALNDLYTSSGASSFSTEDQDRVKMFIRQGALMGQGSVKASSMTDHAAIRRDQLADRAHNEKREDARRASERAWQLKMKGLKLDANGNVVVDPNNPFSTTATGEVMNNFKDGQLNVFGTSGNVYVEGDGSNGKRYRRVGKDQYVEIVNTDPISTTGKPDSKTTDQWKVKNGGYIQSFDEDDDFDGLIYFKEVMGDSDFLNSDGTFTELVTRTTPDNLSSLNKKERDKVTEAVKDSGLNSNELTVLKVKRSGTYDDDVFVVRTSELNKYIDDALEARGESRVHTNTNTGVVQPGNVR